MAQYPPRSSVSRASFITTISNLPEPIGLLPKSSSDIQKSNPECSSSALLFAAALGWSLFLLTLALALILLALLVYQRIRVRLNKGALQTRTNRGIYTAHNANGAQAIVHVSRKGSTRRSGRRNGTLTNVATRYGQKRHVFLLIQFKETLHVYFL